MSSINPLTHERLLELFIYDPETGALTWRTSPRYGINAGYRAGNENLSRPEQPYRQIYLNGKNYRSARLVWFYMTGVLPKKEIDHRNGNPLDDTWSNLRLATSTQNKANQKLRCDNKTGYKGVHRHHNRFLARARIDGKYKYRGMFDTAEEAAAHCRKVTREVHGEYAR